MSAIDNEVTNYFRNVANVMANLNAFPMAMSARSEGRSYNHRYIGLTGNKRTYNTSTLISLYNNQLHRDAIDDEYYTLITRQNDVLGLYYGLKKAMDQRSKGLSHNTYYKSDNGSRTSYSTDSIITLYNNSLS